jgi:hypothetical protein
MRVSLSLVRAYYYKSIALGFVVDLWRNVGAGGRAS